ncbi:hypothetical protein [Anaerotruncus colihominis]|nr:hypothetical protein [Anaerotruncus colihominis]UWN76539.1 hypothetical protein NQ528_08265 [Anaerotruncus colihominis]
MMKCSVCGFEFEAAKEIHYIARVKGSKGFSNLFGEEESIFDAFDCPKCGCQIAVQERKRKLEKVMEDEANTALPY